IVDNDDVETFLHNIYIRSFDKNVLSAKLTREFVYKYVEHVMTNKTYIPTDLVNESTLNEKRKGYVLKTDIPE
ncbi:hypothetical protein M9Y10_036912, partial [Tritrichomonas musculus]